MIKYGVKYVDENDGRTYYVTKDYSVSTNPLDAASFNSRDELKEAAHKALVENEYMIDESHFRTYWSVGRIRGFAFDENGNINLNQSRKPIQSALRVVYREDKTFTAKDGTEYHLTLKRQEGKARRRGGWQDVAYTTVNCNEFPETEWFPYSEGKSASFSTSNETTKPNFWDVDNVATAMIRDYKGWSSGETDKTISEIMSSCKPIKS